MGIREVVGTYATAKVFADDVEDYAIAQIRMICDNEAAEDSRIRVMPDVHPGKVGPIGLTMTVGDRVLPAFVGYDIGCGVLLAQVKAKRVEFKKLDSVIREDVPSGFATRRRPHRFAESLGLGRLRCAFALQRGKAELSLGTLGGGNHFIEVDRDDGGNLYLAIHSGSRHLGKEVSDHYMRLGQEALRAAGEDVPYEMTYLEGELRDDYLHDQRIVSDFARRNRLAMLDEIAKGMRWKVGEVVNCSHNYVDLTGPEPMLRKGAISAKAGEAVVVPINMRDGILVGRGLGNEDWNWSAPHGAGRLYRRDEVKSHFTVSQFKREMEGVYSSCVRADTLDEAPFAYRDLAAIEGAISETVEVEKLLKPAYSFKAGGK